MATTPENAVNTAADEGARLAFLHRVTLRDYKSFAFCDVTLEPLTILVGRNASGKSNFLDALAFLQEAMAYGVPEAVKRRKGWHNVHCRDSSSDTIRFDLEFQILGRDLESMPSWEGAGFGLPVLGMAEVIGLDPSAVYDAHYSLTIAAKDHAAAFVDRESLQVFAGRQRLALGFQYEDEQLALDRHPQETNAPPASFPPIRMPSEQMRQPFLARAGVNAAFLHVTRLIQSIWIYNFQPERIRALQAPARGLYLERDGANLASVIETTRANNPEAVERVGKYFSLIADGVEIRGTHNYGELETARFAVPRGVKGDFLEFDAASMSDGTLRTLASLMAAFQCIGPDWHPSLVAIEEPETSLHPAAMRALVDALDEATCHTQVLLTTHSAEMLDNPTIRPEHVRVVQMSDGQTVIGPPDEGSVEIVRQKLDTLGELERQNQLEPDAEDQERQRHLSQNGLEPRG